MLMKYQWKLHFALVLQQTNLMKIKWEKELNSIYKVVVSMKWSLKEWLLEMVDLSNDKSSNCIKHKLLKLKKLPSQGNTITNLCQCVSVKNFHLQIFHRKWTCPQFHFLWWNLHPRRFEDKMTKRNTLWKWSQSFDAFGDSTGIFDRMRSLTL